MGRVRRHSNWPASNSSRRPKDARRIGHIISDVIYERITGEKGYFDTRIVFVDEVGPEGRARQAARHHGPGRLQRAVPDDRAGSGADAALLPVDAGDHLHVLRGRQRRRSICSTSRPGRRRSSATFPGMTFAPRFSPDGQRIVMSLEQEGNANIYAMDLRSQRTRQLTNDHGHRHLALLFAGRPPDRLRVRPRRHPAALCDERRRLQQHRISFGDGRYRRRSGRRAAISSPSPSSRAATS